MVQRETDCPRLSHQTDHLSECLCWTWKFNFKANGECGGVKTKAYAPCSCSFCIYLFFFILIFFIAYSKLLSVGECTYRSRERYLQHEGFESIFNLTVQMQRNFVIDILCTPSNAWEIDLQLTPWSLSYYSCPLVSDLLLALSQNRQCYSVLLTAHGFYRYCNSNSSPQ